MAVIRNPLLSVTLDGVAIPVGDFLSVEPLDIPFCGQGWSVVELRGAAAAEHGARVHASDVQITNLPKNGIAVAITTGDLDDWLAV